MYNNSFMMNKKSFAIAEQLESLADRERFEAWEDSESRAHQLYVLAQRFFLHDSHSLSASKCGTKAKDCERYINTNLYRN